LLAPSQIVARIRDKSPWWTKAELVAALDETIAGQPWRDRLLNECLQDSVSDVAVAAAVRLATPLGSKLTVSHRLLQTGAACVLSAFRMVPKGAGAVCGIERYFRN